MNLFPYILSISLLVISKESFISAKAVNTQPILSAIDDLRNDIKQIRKQSEEILSNLAGLTQKISKTLNEHPLVLQASQAIDDAGKDGRNVEECREIFDNNAHALIRRADQYLKRIIKTDLAILDEALVFTEQDLDAMRNDLEGDSPNIPDIIDRQDNHFRIIDSLKQKLPHLIESYMGHIQKEKITDLISKNIFEPTTECLDIHELKLED